MDFFAHSWARAWAGCGARGDGVGIRDALQARYREPHRRYHTLEHLGECLAAFTQVATLPSRPAAVELAIWFHDAIYETRRGDNEMRSAEWARQVLHEAGAASGIGDRVYPLIMATRHDAVPSDHDAQVLVDIDLCILGADLPRFAEYEAQIREEYAFVPGWLFRFKRRALLRGLLARPQIYNTPFFHAAFEAKARENLGRALARGTR